MPQQPAQLCRLLSRQPPLSNGSEDETFLKIQIMQDEIIVIIQIMLDNEEDLILRANAQEGLSIREEAQLGRLLNCVRQSTAANVTLRSR
jgi:hypothetical protein